MAKLEDLKVSFISLVEKPANKKDVILKAESKWNMNRPIKVVKTEEKEKEGLIYGEVYRADEVDAQGDWTDYGTLKKAAHEFLWKGQTVNVDTDHNENKSGAAVVESYLDEAQKSWNVVIKTDKDSELFQKVKKGEYKGLSLMGVAVRKDEADPPKADNKLESRIGKMEETQEEILAILKGVPKFKHLKFDKEEKGGSGESELEEFSLLDE